MVPPLSGYYAEVSVQISMLKMKELEVHLKETGGAVLGQKTQMQGCLTSLVRCDTFYINVKWKDKTLPGGTAAAIAKIFS